MTATVTAPLSIAVSSTPSVFRQRPVRQVQSQSSTHLFAVGQAVRLKGGFGHPSQFAGASTSPPRCRRAATRPSIASATTTNATSASRRRKASRLPAPPLTVTARI
ncbi:hypothetical protein [Methylobrevis pamukkalensis]|uniref:Uncharacterized protein n=1 Tax=Methylobrevis pamukkalensis TaxID=1439726 RepID=A0A1E3H654_9HYPH|nr:hypothetical protein [Methylobrevis pamukkalensis]ODN71794.1 hypothetical protein A6302_00833 [Methylobrevis pamukkalensis]